MRINSNRSVQESQRVTESGVRVRRREERDVCERGEGEGRGVRTESEKCMVSAGRY